MLLSLQTMLEMWIPIERFSSQSRSQTFRVVRLPYLVQGLVFGMEKLPPCMLMQSCESFPSESRNERIRLSVSSPLVQGIAFEMETPSKHAARLEVESELATRVRTRAVEEALSALIDAVQTPNPVHNDSSEEEDNVARELEFVRRNLGGDEPVYFRQEEYARVAAVADAVAAIEDRASKGSDGQAEEGNLTSKGSSKERWNGSIQELKGRLELLGNAGGAEGLRQRFVNLTEKMRIPPKRRAILRRAMLLTLVKAVEGVIEGVEDSRALSSSEERNGQASMDEVVGTSETGEEKAGEVEIEPDEEVLKAQIEARERAFREEAVRCATERASAAFDGFEEALERSDRSISRILDEEASKVTERGERTGADKALLDWTVFSLERQKQRLLQG